MNLDELVETTAEGVINIAHDELPDQPLLRSLFYSELANLLQELAIIEVGVQQYKNEIGRNLT